MFSVPDDSATFGYLDLGGVERVEGAREVGDQIKYGVIGLLHP
jgi:hypothetical protein